MNKETRDECIAQLQMAWPITGAMLLRRSVDLISVVFVGHIGREYLAGVGLATVTANVTGYSMLIGLTGGLSTQAGIAKGARDVPALVLSFQRCVFVAACACIPITLLWLNAYPIISYLGQSAEIARTASTYIAILIPGLWAYSLAACIQVWLYAQSDTTNIAYMAVVQTAVHPFINYWLIYTRGMGWTGAAWATAASKVVYLVMLMCYVGVKYVTQMKMRLHVPTWEVFSPTGLVSLLKLALPNILMMTEWWASEIVIFLSGLLPQPELHVAAMSIFQNTNSIW
jgi:MATE family multidrug resistance protein